MGIKITLGILLTVGAAYMLYVPFPEACDYPWLMKASHSVFELVNIMGGINVMFGGSFAAPFRFLEKRAPKNVDGIDSEDTILGGVEVTIYKPSDFAKDGPGAAMIFFHGGGWTIGSVGSYAKLTAAMAQKTGMLLIVPEYRLAPDHPFPAAFDDSVAVTKDLLKRAKEFNVDEKKIVLAGDSAGGNLAVGVSLEIGLQNPKKKNPICMANPIYPSLQIANLRQASYLQNPNGPLLPPSLVARFLINYLGVGNQTELIPLLMTNAHMNGFQDKDGVLDRMNSKWVPEKYKQRPMSGDEVIVLNEEDLKPLLVEGSRIQKLATDRRLAPLAASDEELKIMPYTHITTCEYDVLRDDGIILNERMKHIGKKVSHINWEFCSHGLFGAYPIGGYEKLNNAVDDMLNIIMKQIKNC